MRPPLTADGQQHNTSLILFVTGEAPRSRRAHRNLTAALDAGGFGTTRPHEIDLVQDPQQAISYEVFAAPALMHIDASGHRRVLYGDLSDEHSLKDFLSALR